MELGEASASVSACIAWLRGISEQERREAAFTLAWEQWSRRKKWEALRIDGAVLKSAPKVGLLSKGDQGKSII